MGLKHSSNCNDSLLTQNNAQWTFHLSQELSMDVSPLSRVINGRFTSLISNQTDTKEFQSHGNKCTVDISHP